MSLTSTFSRNYVTLAAVLGLTALGLVALIQGMDGTILGGIIATIGSVVTAHQVTKPRQ
jgi:hypothetical protein